MAKEREPEPRPLGGLQKSLLALLVVLLLGSIGARAWTRRAETGHPTPPAGAHGLVETPPASSTPGPPPTPLERALPYVTEGSFFGLIGFALGYTTRKFVKFGLILLALFFVALQALVWTGTVTVDWHGMVEALNRLLFNLKENESITAFLTRRIPSGGGMLLGYAVGFRR